MCANKKIVRVFLIKRETKKMFNYMEFYAFMFETGMQESIRIVGGFF
jgi:hypothetical protein